MDLCAHSLKMVTSVDSHVVCGKSRKKVDRPGGMHRIPDKDKRVRFMNLK